MDLQRSKREFASEGKVNRLTTTSPAEADAALRIRHHQELEELFNRYIPVDRPVALLQFPGDFNVGNHMMWVAINDYLRRRRVRIAYAGYSYNFQLEDMIRAVGDGPILFLGGVTVSRLWPGHAEIKRTVAAACPNNRLISLPSTMIFVDDEDRREASQIFGGHPDVVMMARDPVSAQAAREVFPNSVTVVHIHDSAFSLPPQRRSKPPIHDIVWLARDDQERADAETPKDVHVFDWRQSVALCSRLVFVSRGLSRLRGLAPKFAPVINLLIALCFDLAARSVLRSGNLQLDTGKVLVTDRLHPHVLAALRDQHSVLLPDRYGKNRAVYEYSSHEYSTVHWADTPLLALEIARELAMRL